MKARPLCARAEVLARFRFLDIRRIPRTLPEARSRYSSLPAAPKFRGRVSSRNVRIIRAPVYPGIPHGIPYVELISLGQRIQRERGVRVAESRRIGALSLSSAPASITFSRRYRRRIALAFSHSATHRTTDVIRRSALS